MDSVRTFFASFSKDAGHSNNQQNRLGAFSGINTIGNGSIANGSNEHPDTKITNQNEVKQKDMDSYFYIMWRS
ncbi:uncharacterized protein LOC119684106 [Teleopsis dalmanni]|uniref:uncharacterized protein LOC119684106 n=1 Tax=Teleopsis dalmanni TaxID=139649 RepID=UPI000D32A0BA|nr:uncharacterized protein LOC119684106 [Teleopsis dalmanni]XP_037953984.1 uncharacterized protein LOC119684106 [Teleopsis dalmanni]